MDYKIKYLKYKEKYLNLKNSLRGGDISNDDLIHIWYKNWPDQGIPQMDNFFKFITYCNEDIKKRGGGSVIHCSGGIGRTGTVYVILKLINLFDTNPGLKSKYSVNDVALADLIRETVLESRHHRPQMVERVEQYLGIYQIVKKYLDNNYQLQDITRASFYDSSGNQNDFFTKNEIFKRMSKEFCEMPEYAIPGFYGSFQNELGSRNDCKLVTKTPYPKDGLHPVFSCTKDKICVGHGKNRYDDNPATSEYGVSLCNPNCDLLNYKKTSGNILTPECYINADFMMPYFTQGNVENIVIATQAPHSNETTDDLKKMVKLYKIKRIIMLTLLEEVVYDINYELKKGETGYGDRKFAHKVRANDYFAKDTTIQPLKLDASCNFTREPTINTAGYFAATYVKDKDIKPYDPHINKTPNIAQRYIGDEDDKLPDNPSYSNVITTQKHENSKIFKVGIVNKNNWLLPDSPTKSPGVKELTKTFEKKK